MNQPYARVNQPYATLTLASALREMFGVQLYKNNARALLSRILSILNLDWLQHARSVRGVYEYTFIHSLWGCYLSGLHHIVWYQTKRWNSPEVFPSENMESLQAWQIIVLNLR